METRKLYYEDCMRNRFTAQVMTCEEREKGYAVTLSETCFYPEGGGQANDTGILGTARVLHVREVGEAVEHLCDKPLTVGDTVEGTIDFDRRFDGMQAHTGEHILSGLIHARFGYDNMGFHMGKEVMEVDFDGLLTAEDLALLEQQANEAVWANLPVRAWIPSREALPHLVYRSKRALPWPVRIVEIPGIDSCACCGVHTATTGQVGVIKILSCVKFRQGVRLELVCGRKALEYLQSVFEQNRQVSQLLSAKMLETGTAAKRMLDTLNAEKYRAAGLQRKIFDTVAEGCRGKTNVLHYAQDLTPGGVRELAQAIASKIGGIAAVYAGSDASGYCICLLSEHTEVQTLGSALRSALNLRGGGKKEAFQGTLQASKAQIEAFFANVWKE